MPALTVEQAAEELGVSEWTIRNLAKSGKLIGKKIGKSGWRFSLTAIELFLCTPNPTKEKEKNQCQSQNVVKFTTPVSQPQAGKGYLEAAKRQIKQKRKNSTTA